MSIENKTFSSLLNILNSTRNIAPIILMKFMPILLPPRRAIPWHGTVAPAMVRSIGTAQILR